MINKSRLKTKKYVYYIRGNSSVKNYRELVVRELVVVLRTENQVENRIYPELLYHKLYKSGIYV